jgi:N-acetylglucosamine-6-phosphate deacetylase
MEHQKNFNGKTAIINGLYLEGPFLNRTQCGALDAGTFLPPDETLFMHLVEGFEDIIRIITVAPELEGSVELIKKITDMGIIVSMGHSDATYSEAEDGYNAGARGITHLFNAMRSIHHREPGIAGFGLMNHDIYIEVIADPFHLDHRIIEFIFNIKNNDKIIVISDSIRDAMIAGPSKKGIRNKSNKLMGGSMPVTDAPDLLAQQGLNKERVMQAISENPEKYLQIN